MNTNTPKFPVSLDLTPDEIELINLYRNLTAENQLRLAQIISSVCVKAPVLCIVGGAA